MRFLTEEEEEAAVQGIVCKVRSETSGASSHHFLPHKRKFPFFPRTVKKTSGKQG